jgi:hypothetical protein
MPAPNTCVAILFALAATAASASADSLSAAQLETLGPATTVGRGITPSAGTAHARCFTAGVPPAGAATRSSDVGISVRALEPDEALGTDARAVVEAHASASQDPAPRRRLLATLTVRALSAALDEQVSPVAPTPLGLLRTGDVSGFFRACGTHYVRAVTLETRHLVALSYVAGEAEADAAFEAALRGVLARMAAGEASRADEAALAAESAARGLYLTARLPGAAAAFESSVRGTGVAQGTPVSFSLPGHNPTVRAAFDNVLGALLRGEPERVIDAELAPWNRHPEVLAALSAPLDVPPPPATATAGLLRLDDGRRLDRSLSRSHAGAPPDALDPLAPASRRPEHPSRVAALTGGGTAGLALELRGEWAGRPARSGTLGVAAHAALFAERGEVALGVVPTWSRRSADWRTFAGLGVGVLFGGADGAGAAGLVELGGELPLARRWFATGAGRVHVGPDRAAFTLNVGLALGL